MLTQGSSKGQQLQGKTFQSGKSENDLEKTFSSSNKKDPASFLEKMIGRPTKSDSTFALRIYGSTTSGLEQPFTPQPSPDTQTAVKQVFVGRQCGRSHQSRFSYLKQVASMEPGLLGALLVAVGSVVALAATLYLRF